MLKIKFLSSAPPVFSLSWRGFLLEVAMNKKFDDLLEDDLACFLCALIAFVLFFGTLTLVLGADAFQRWLLCM